MREGISISVLRVIGLLAALAVVSVGCTHEQAAIIARSIQSTSEQALAQERARKAAYTPYEIPVETDPCRGFVQGWYFKGYTEDTVPRKVVQHGLTNEIRICS